MNEVISLTYPAEFFKAMYDKQDDYLDFAQDYEPMKAFYEGEQLQIFEKAIPPHEDLRGQQDLHRQ